MTDVSIRRRAVIAAAALASVGAGSGASAQAGRAVKIVVGFPPGQATDSVARLLAEKLRAQTQNTYVVDNRPGSGGSLAMSQVAKASADGSTLMLTHMSAVATNPSLYRKVGYESIKDFQAVGLVGDLPFVLAVNAGLPIHSVADLVRYVNSGSEQLTSASSGNGTVSHLAMEEFKRRVGIKVLHVPYKGSGPGLTDVAAGIVSMALETAAAVRPLVESGKLRAIAVGSRQRLAGVYADVPTMAEAGVRDFTASTWLMMIYPAGVSKQVVQSTFQALEAVMKQPETQQKMTALGALPRTSASPEEAQAYLKAEVGHWADVVRRSGVTLD